MNRPDGSVEIAAEGEESKLDELRRKAAQGPDGAEVTEVKDLPPGDDLMEFPFEMRRYRG
jgi:acylphosphatase